MEHSILIVFIYIGDQIIFFLLFYFSNGAKSSGESHFVYMNKVTNTRAVLSFLMESSLSRNIRSIDKRNSYSVKETLEWKRYFDMAQKLTQENDSMSITLSLTSLMGNKLNEFWRYEGSLTTPPCTEHVIWTIFKEPILILDYEFNSFRHDLFFESYRGPQPLYYRKVYKSFTDEIRSPIPDQNCCIQTKSNGKSILFNNNIISLFFYNSNLHIFEMK
ncbi:hypothetical protein I4U23_006034 [Adineta vaga]|nr:hypothetical protein I4U23_006034 [Adineta vaga]